ncbi:MAG: bifunctional regulator KidO [Alphaproteobacteria bacterium]|nr:bifunctional regulator KidO [Alphaproteobacteria bacterium]
MKLGLGTVQFGQAYGVSNSRGQVHGAEVGAILNRAAQAGIRVLDTAANYGVAEEVLGGLDLSRFRVVSKTTGLSHGLDMVLARVRRSAATLGRFDTLLVHFAKDLLGDNGLQFWAALQGLRDEGLFSRLGIVAYVAEDPVILAQRFQPQVMQVPFSVLDQRLLKSGALARLKDFGVEIHARSVFLQGLLFLDVLPEKLRHAALELAVVKATITASGTTPLAAALGFVLSRPEIDVALVGVTSLGELEEILTASALPLPALDWSALALNDEVVLTPSLW